MTAKELKITIPENHEIDWQESAKQEKIVFKKKDTKPRSWVEYCELMKINNHFGYDIMTNGSIHPVKWALMNTPNRWKTTLPSKELAEAFVAMAQLMSLRQAWIGDWKPDWSNEYLIKYCISGKCCDFEIWSLSKGRHPLSFPTQEMAEDFMNCFKDLLEVAKPLV